MTDPATVERRCAVLLRLAAREDEQGHATEARELFAAALCEARRNDRQDLLVEVRRACAGAHASDTRRTRRSARLF